MIEHERFDAGSARPLESRRECLVRDDYGYCSTQRASRGGVDQRLEVAAATGDQDADQALSGWRDAGSEMGVSPRLLGMGVRPRV
jgi:hypothetical protein